MNIPDKIKTNFTSEEIIKGFYQNGTGNCVSVASIKASLMAFQTKPVFETIEVSNDNITIEMRDGFTENITSEDLILAKRLSEFKKVNSLIYNHAILMFAAMAKRAQVEGNDGIDDMNYAEALNSLNDGEDYKEGLKWLGLKEYIIYGPNRKIAYYGKAKRFLKKTKAGIGKSPKHAWFSSNGINDEYGTLSEIRGSTSGALALDVDKIYKL